MCVVHVFFFFFFQAEDGIRDDLVTGVQTCALPISALTLDGERIELLANIEQPGDGPAAVHAGAVGVGLFRTEFLFMGRGGNLPGEEEQYRAYREAVDRSEEHTSELQSPDHLVCRLLLEKKKKK